MKSCLYIFIISLLAMFAGMMLEKGRTFWIGMIAAVLSMIVIMIIAVCDLIIFLM